MLGGCRVITAGVGDKHPQKISKAKPDNSTESGCVDTMETLCPLSVKHLFFQICSGHKHLSSCHNNLLSCVLMSFDWIIWQVSLGKSRGKCIFSSVSLCGTFSETCFWPPVRGGTDKLSGMVDSTCETGWAEISGGNIILAQLVGLVVLKDDLSKAHAPEISLCLRQKLLPWPCAREWSQSWGCLLSCCDSPS